MKEALAGARQARDGSTTLRTSFIWGVGIEGSALPHLDVDQFQWTQHNRRWAQDLKLVREELHLRHLRYALPWHYLEPAPGRFDWSIADERVGRCGELGLELLLDVMHFGTPRWLELAVGDPAFPEALERLTRALVERYRRQVRFWCPVNEPLVTSLFSGDFGFWPPHGRGWRGYFPVLARVALATSRAIRAIRELHPAAVVVLPDAAERFTTRHDELRQEVRLRGLRRFLMLDLIAGRVDARHPLHEWVTAYGMSELDLRWFALHPQMPDVIGLDYYAHSDWQLEPTPWGIHQRRSDCPAGLYGIAMEYHARYGRTLMVTETSIEGRPINREVWLQRLVEDARRLRSEGVPLVGLFWWPLLDHLDWDGAMTHRIGKLHQVGLFRLVRQKDGQLRRLATPTASTFARLARQGAQAVGPLECPAIPQTALARQRAPVGQWTGSLSPTVGPPATTAPAREGPAPTGAAARPRGGADADRTHRGAQAHLNGNPGIVVFSHLRWGFVWQRPQQFLSRFARSQPVLFVEEPLFDLPDAQEPHLELHRVMPNVTVAVIHCGPAWARDRRMPELLRRRTAEAMSRASTNGAFARPLLWYYNPADAAWSLGHFDHSGVVYDCMDELSRFAGAPPSLAQAERRLMRHADVVFAGGQSLCARKGQDHDNVHCFGCGVEAEHFAAAMEEDTPIPPDIDFMPRPILGWFGVIDERVDYVLLAELARLRPRWSFAMVGPVVKIDPNLLPHAPNLFWLGGRDYAVLPHYAKAFNVCMLCFAVNAATEFINPTKTLEYLATGRPVISTPVPDVVRQFADVVDIAPTPAAFIAAVERALARPDPGRSARGLERARQCGWDAIVERMRALIRQSLSRPRRRSAAPIEPPADTALEYSYVGTPGS